MILEHEDLKHFPPLLDTQQLPETKLQWDPTNDPEGSEQWLSQEIAQQYDHYQYLLSVHSEHLMSYILRRKDSGLTPEKIQVERDELKQEVKVIEGSIKRIEQLSFRSGMRILIQLAEYKLAGVPFTKRPHSPNIVMPSFLGKVLIENESVDDEDTAEIQPTGTLTSFQNLLKEKDLGPWESDELELITEYIAAVTSPTNQDYYDFLPRHGIREQVLTEHLALLNQYGLTKEAQPFLDWQKKIEAPKPKISSRNQFSAHTEAQPVTQKGQIELGLYTQVGGYIREQAEIEKGKNEDNHFVSEYFIRNPDGGGQYIIHATVVDGISTTGFGNEDSILAIEKIHEKPSLTQQELDDTIMATNRKMGNTFNFPHETRGTTLATMVITLEIDKDGKVTDGNMIRGNLGDTSTFKIDQNDKYEQVNQDHNDDNAKHLITHFLSGDDVNHTAVTKYSDKEPQIVRVGEIWGIKCDGIILKPEEIIAQIRNGDSLQNSAKDITESSVQRYKQETTNAEGKGRWDDATLILIKIPEVLDLNWLHSLPDPKAA